MLVSVFVVIVWSTRFLLAPALAVFWFRSLLLFGLPGFLAPALAVFWLRSLLLLVVVIASASVSYPSDAPVVDGDYGCWLQLSL